MRRNDHLTRLEHQTFDLLVIGGGATGAGVALDGANRGLKVALVERDDFAAGTSSRSTKLVHGGVRYLEAALTHFDRAQFQLVREALAERATLLTIAPHLVHPLRTVVPVYTWPQAMVYRSGLWLYDRAAGKAAIERSHGVSRAAMLRSFPSLRRHGLKGGVAYYDGQFDDARMAITLLTSAVHESATIANRVAATALLQDKGRIVGARALDRVADRTFTVHARVVINATGPGADALRCMADPETAPLLAPSRGSHIALDPRWAPAGDGLLVPRTADGRVLFLLPWQGQTIAGTTDNPAAPTADPQPLDADIDYLLAQLGQWLEPAPTRADVRAAWAGLRPLISDATAAADSARIVREHHVELGPSGLITAAGGKWTTYRLMAEETVDRAVDAAGLEPRHGCRTRELPLAGARGYSPQLATELASRYALPADIAAHLAHAYGDQAIGLLDGADGHRRLAPGHPWIEAEVTWARDHEMALSAADVLARRTRLAFVDAAAANRARTRVDALLAA